MPLGDAEVLSIRCETAHFLHLLLDKAKAKAKVKGKGNNPSSHIKIGEGRWPTPINNTRHLSKLKPDLPNNRLRTLAAESMRCERRKQRMLLML